ncbi:MAG: quinolinate synthase NadA [Candidatus Omnitrophica bacterium]|jgi:quinolinate synthase|nr:quinolinate synthase NadA [Candidatus Omnitrophota bacterium]
MSLEQEILKLKKKRDAVILAHNYQISAIQDIADFVGDSLELAKTAKKAEKSTIVFCGVKFMAETAKILSPEKKVLLPSLDAGCPLADMIEPSQLLELKQKYPKAQVVSYVNTSAEIKALSDVCCTSSNAVTVVKNIPSDMVIFTPDRNLGWWVKKNVPDKKLIIWKGFCLVHEYFSLEDLRAARKAHPDAEILAHPECRKEILEEADFVFSTSGMLKHAQESSAKKFIIGTEEGLIYRLKKENPQKIFYSLGPARTCINMKKTTLRDLYNALDKEDCQIELDSDIIKKASQALERMVKYV